MRAIAILSVALLFLSQIGAKAVPSLDLAETHMESDAGPGGSRIVCEDGVCRLVEDDDVQAGDVSAPKPDRLILGLREVDEFLEFLGAAGASGDAKGEGAFGTFTWLTLLLALLGGMAMNLTPCVLPMIPVNLIIIGKSPLRGAVYGLGMAMSYGLLGILASFGLLAFGTIQSSPWFNAFVAVVFLALALSMLGMFSIDFSRFRPGALNSEKSRASLFAPLFMGALSAVLAGACVAPVLISVIVLTARLSAEGNYFVLLLPFALGVGMALPWPFLGAGMKVLPKPGAWMVHVNRIFGVLILLFYAWYAHLAIEGWSSRGNVDVSLRAADNAIECVPSNFESAFREAAKSGKPIFVDCWATWCKNCTAMERTTLADERVKDALSRFTVIRLDATKMQDFRKLAPFGDVQGLPAYAIFANGNLW